MPFLLNIFPHLFLINKIRHSGIVFLLPKMKFLFCQLLTQQRSGKLQISLHERVRRRIITNLGILFANI